MAGFLTFLMAVTLLGAVVQIGRKRNGNAAILFVVGIACGFIYYAISPAPKTDSSVSSDQAVANADDATQAPDRHADREVVRDWWEQVGTDLALSDAALGYAQQDIQNENLAEASQLLAQGQKYSSAALDLAGNHQPSGWDDVGGKLVSTSSDFGDALGHLRDALDSGKPSDAAAALDSSQAANENMAEATHLARVQYESMGGKWSDLDDIDTQRKALGDLMSLLTK
jgi:hypothetical protein